MNYIDNYLQSKGGFDFSLTNRNIALEKTGIKPPGFTKTGTTIVGVKFKDGVILAADTRATSGTMVADKNCLKLHPIAPNMWCAGAGTAADLEHVCYMMSAKLKLARLNTGRESRVHQLTTKFIDHLFQYQGHVGCAIIIGGIDCQGSHIVSISPYGNYSYSPFTSMGSGSLAALGILEAKYQDDLDKESGVLLAIEAIEAGIFNDLGSGSNVDVSILTKGNIDFRRNVRCYNRRAKEEQFPYQFPRNNTRKQYNSFNKQLAYIKQFVYSIEKQELNEVQEKEEDKMDIIE